MAKRSGPREWKRELARGAVKDRRGRLVERVKVERSELQGTRTSCKKKKACAKRKAAELREKRRALVEACRTASAEGRAKVAAARAALDAFRAEQRSTPAAPAAKLRRTSAESRAESDAEVERNIEPELGVVWRRVRRSIHASPHRSRTEAFLEWCEANPGEVERLQWEAAERDVDRMVREYNAAGWDVEVAS